MTGGIHTTTVTPAAIASHVRYRRSAARFARCRYADHDATATVKALSPTTSSRYGTCVCAQNEPASAATGSMGASPATIDHNARTNTMKHSSGRYGFHGWGGGSAPQAGGRRASTAATAIINLIPARRKAIQSAVPIASKWSATVETCIAQDDAPNARYIGQSAQKLIGPGWLP